MRYWLFKSEPSAYSWDDLVRDKVGCWDGVRNYQARNLLRDEIKVGDQVLFYHSNAEPMAVVGIAEVVKNGYPDHTAWDRKSDHPDEKSTPENPIWYMVDIKAKSKFKRAVTLEELKGLPALKDMMLTQRGSRLSVQPVSKQEFETVVKLGSK